MGDAFAWGIKQAVLEGVREYPVEETTCTLSPEEHWVVANEAPTH
jgi:hypothetical protein